MTSKELEFAAWQTPLQELLVEFDHEKLSVKTQKVETLIFECLQQPDQGGDGHVEQQAINDALSQLRIIQRDRLGFPDWA